ncbi:MAG: 1-deoxy-D-xylulose-5-phosphate synthase, partial [Firmicutes bacterium]|nr:1-deoxy-D-xylulose-5-phosphate synthase [Candidatus Caballimonas caccae]
NNMSLLENIKSQNDVKKLNDEQSQLICDEIRKNIIDKVKENGGHLASNLGIVETTVALCRIFDFKSDKIIFDVGHQCYPYKIRTGRFDKFATVRKKDGISGFPDREESEYDSFISGHAGTSIGAGLGKCLARDNKKEDYYVIDIVGDGAISNGLNLEALTANSEKPKKYIVILNDNGMSISKNHNGFYQYISEKRIDEKYVRRKRRIKKVFGESFITRFLRKFRNAIKRILKLQNAFESFGFKYVGVFDGNNVNKMTKILEKVKNYAKNEAVLLHIKTKKGKGFLEAEKHADSYHGVGANLALKTGAFSIAVGETLNEIIQENKKVYALTAGMATGTGLKVVEDENPNNFIDVGIAEEYAVNLSAGMASEGLKPVVCIYSTFMQRVYDQVLHDVCIQNLPVVFCIDRAGLVGNDGKTHQGVFDLSFLSHLPNIKIYAPKSVSELKEMLKVALKENCPVAIRYPNENDLCENTSVFDGKWERVSIGKDATILAVGPRMNDLANRIKEQVDVEIINARIVKPLDYEMLDSIKNDKIITIEENSIIGGFGSQVISYFEQKNNAKSIKTYGVPDRFIKNASVLEQLENCGLTLQNILEQIKSF